VLVKVGINSLNSGRVQISVSKPQANPQPVQTYPSPKEAREVLLEFCIDGKEIDDTLKLLSDVGPNQPLHFFARDIPQKVLSDYGFKL